MVAVPGGGQGGITICKLCARYVLRHKTSMVFEELSHQREGVLLGFAIVPTPPPSSIGKSDRLA